jgi:hypothetical protein
VSPYSWKSPNGGLKLKTWLALLQYEIDCYLTKVRDLEDAS